MGTPASLPHLHGVWTEWLGEDVLGVGPGVAVGVIWGAALGPTAAAPAAKGVQGFGKVLQAW